MFLLCHKVSRFAFAASLIWGATMNCGQAKATGLIAGTTEFHKTQVDASAQLLYLRVNDLIIQVYGAEFGAWYRIASGLDVGASMRQFYSFANGASAILSSLNVKGRWYLTGGSLPYAEHWTKDGVSAIIKTYPTTGGLHIDPAIEQISLNSADSSDSFSAFGLLIGYDLGIGDNKAVGIGVGASRMTNDVATLVPLRGSLSFQVSF